MKTIESSCTTKEWKARQEAYHAMTADEDRPDDLNKHEIIDIPRHELAFDVLYHFKELPPEFRYPSKSYVVAIVYARLLSEFFGYSPYCYLEDPDLLFGSDPHFKTYSEDKELYDKVIDFIGWKFDLNQGTPIHIVPYFYKEFLITEKEIEGWNAIYNK